MAKGFNVMFLDKGFGGEKGFVTFWGDVYVHKNPVKFLLR